MRFLALLTLLLVAAPLRAELTVDPSLPVYQTDNPMSGVLRSRGSDTMAILMELWSKSYQRDNPGVRFEIEAKGSATAPPGLISGETDLGPMSRLMNERELAAFTQEHGYAPTAIRVGIDALAVYVHQQNPLNQLEMSEVDAIFSATRRCGAKRDVSDWGALFPDWSGRAIQLYGRNKLSGTYGYFRKKALCKGEYKPSLQSQVGSAEVLQKVAQDPNGIGYSGIGYKIAGVKAVDLAARKGRKYIVATFENAAMGDYPLSRFLYLYVNKAPGKSIAPLTRDFMRFVLSLEGQKATLKDGYIPLSSDVVYTDLAKLH